MHQAAVALAPWRGVAQLDFTHAFQDRKPKITEHRERFSGHHRFIQHLPHHGQFNQRSRASFAGHKSMRDANQLEQAILPGSHANFFIDPWICFRGEKFRRDAVSLAAALLRAARNRGHYASVAAAAHREIIFGQNAAERASRFVVSFPFLRARTAKNRNDALFFCAHSDFALPRSLCFSRDAFRSNSSIMATHSPSSASSASWFFPPWMLLIKEKIKWRPLIVSAYPERVRTCSTEPVLA